MNLLSLFNWKRSDPRVELEKAREKLSDLKWQYETFKERGWRRNYILPAMRDACNQVLRLEAEVGRGR